MIVYCYFVFLLQYAADEPIILIKNYIGALRRGHFNVTRSLLNIEFSAYAVYLENVAVWIIREMCLYGSLPDDIVFNLKIDVRPLFGKCMRSTFYGQLTEA